MASRHVVESAILLAAIGASAVANAQCPDGSPPPCRGAAGARRIVPPLSERAWIVVPFANVARAADLDWLRDASVDLLSLDLSRWTDISVVDDKRVADLVRTLPAARARQALSLDDGITLARRAGAGRLVMGDFIKVGRGARLIANVFDVRRGTQIRSAQQNVADTDSLLTAFGPLARGVLAVPPPPDAHLGATGTTSADAYREYVLGLAALHRFELAESRQHFLAALKYDSTFALAHYKLSIAMHWAGPGAAAEEREHAIAAARLGGSLPPRERALISSRVSSAGGDYERACGTLAQLVEHDSSDVEALYGLGDCRYHAGFLPALPTADSTRGRFRGDWNGAIAAFRRVLQIDPSYHPAFEHVLDMLTRAQVLVCIDQRPGCGNDQRIYVTYVLRDADSLLLQPVRGDFRVKMPWANRQDGSHSLMKNLRAAQRIAQEWVDAGPGEPRAHSNLAMLDMQLGDFAAADRELGFISARADRTVRASALEMRVKTGIMLHNVAAARSALDTLMRESAGDSSMTIEVASLAATFGRVRPLVAALESYGVAHQWSPERRAYTRNRPYVLMGVILPGLADDERRYGESMPRDTLCAAGRPGCPTTALLSSLAFAPRMPRTWHPFSSTVPTGVRYFGPWVIARGDTAYIRTAAHNIDSVATAKRLSGTNDFGLVVHAAELYLAVHDSINALRMTRIYVDSVTPERAELLNDDWDWPYLAVPRMMRLRADLAGALGYADEARTWYARALALWADSDPEFKPEVDRMRAALEHIGRAR